MDGIARKFLLALARQTIVDYFNVGEKIIIKEDNLPDMELAKKAATFVTLTQNGNLRGCVGSLLPKKKIYQDVINNALMAGFGDTRFTPVKESELTTIKIEISILSNAEPYIYNNYEELIHNIKPNIHGVIIQQGFNQATYLPQVWQEIGSKEDFLSSLCQKAGLEKYCWKDKNTEVFFYTVEKFSE